ncbi:hemolysin III family protein [uncultured Piscinibacter sp.]|uniref:PAQR family membrane homeostasis protein TrhA n=1 Tax=uncultured Piscinibacter sp. TaxID=1131835 RepID=UPI0026392B1C|nr:hemolysin III family protein [uncultured Piscinibacter sp.]
MRLTFAIAPRTASARRAQTRAEEIANAASHALACALPLMAWPTLSEAAQRQAGALGVASVAVFCLTMVMQFMASAVYHALPAGRAKLWARAVDHAAIYLFIAGSSTPFTLGAMPGPEGVATCALVWTLATVGASLKLMRRLTNQRLSTGLYLLLGWGALLAAWPGLQGLEASALLWLFAGGLSYLVGTAFFVFDSSLRFGHFVWHLCVMAGSGCHLFAALRPGLN